MGSYLDARSQRGRWLVRIEDLDTPRVIPGSADRILRTLEQFGLQWDGPLVYQSARAEFYLAAVERLRAGGLTFECSCSRRELTHSEEAGYPGTCRTGPTRPGPTATRFRVNNQLVRFDDRIQGPCRFDLGTLGDFVIRRKDGLFSYQLAVVVDDAGQAITDVVRGADLLSSTAWQVALQRELGMSTPRYAHLPLVVEPNDEKLAKSRHSVPVEPAAAGVTLRLVLQLLNHPPPPELEGAQPAQLLQWAQHSWNPQVLHGVRTVASSAQIARKSWV